MNLQYSSKTALFLLIAVLAVSMNTAIAQEAMFKNPKVEKIWGGFNFVEGPVWVDDLGLLFSDIPENKIYLFSIDSTISVYKTPSGNSNGLRLDKDGNLLLCQHGPRQIGRLEETMDITALATHYNGLRLNSPNDLHIASDNSIFFTDPPYGLNDQGGTSELGYNGIYHLMPSGKLYMLDNSLSRPNGIALSPDEKKLYVTDCEVRRIHVWDVINDSTISNKKQVASMQGAGCADGMKVDSNGFLYSTGPGGIWIYKPDGTFVKTISVPGQTTNCAFGGADGKTLFVTSGNSIYRITEKVETPPNAINSLDANSNRLSVWPNPANSSATISFYLHENNLAKLSIYNSLGQNLAVIAQNDFQKGRNTISWQTENLSNGLYYVVLATVESSETIKFVLSR